MGFGIGLGSFVDGFARGVGIRQSMDERAERAKRFQREEEEAAELKGDREYARGRRVVEDAREDSLAAESAGDRAYTRDRLRLEDQRADTTYNRNERKIVNLEGIEQETRQQFDQAVEAGTADPNQYDEFWLKYALPKKQAELLAQGDVDGAKALMEWGQSADALKGGRLFASAMLKAQTGDAAGALSDAIEAGKVGGYIKSGYEVAGQTAITDEAGNLLGYRLNITGPDGKAMEQDIRVDDVPSVVSTFLNPDAAWQSQVAAGTKATDRANELEDYEKKKEIDAKYDRLGGKGADPAKLRSDAIAALRKRLEGDFSGKGAFDDLDANEKERLIQEEIDLQTGASAAPVAPKEKVVVDTVTGKVVKPRIEADAKTGRGGRAVGLGGGSQVGVINDRLLPSDPSALPKSADEERVRILQEAEHAIQNGGDPMAISQRLMNAGIPQESWPQRLYMMAPGLTK